MGKQAIATSEPVDEDDMEAEDDSFVRRGVGHKKLRCAELPKPLDRRG
jgi:hypothetical protein